MPNDRIDRRDAIRSMAAIVAAPLLMPAIPAPDRIGLALYTVRDLAARDFEGTLRAIAEIGYRDLDMYIYVSGREPRETRAALDRAGLTCRSARVATPALYRGWERYLDAANVLGARWITLANVSPEERLSMRDWEELAVVFNDAGERARRVGLTFCYHNHDFELQRLEGRVPLDVMLGATDPDLVRLQMDVYWITKGGRSAVGEIRRLGPRVATLHLKDMDATPRRGITTVGQGTIDFAAVLRAAKNAGVTDVFVEEDSPAEPLAAARQSYAHLTRLAL
jgi:sugar phosphate isomerase/epimerase